jgi:hypothetical protein
MPLQYATIKVLENNKNFVTNSSGYFSFNVTGGTYTITLSYLGYKSDTITFNAEKNIFFNFLMKEKTYIYEVSIKSDKNNIIKNTETGVTRIEMKDISKLPAFMGEVDILKILQLAPGVQSSKEGTTGIYIRGGTPDQNLVLFDNGSLYNPFHLFGFFPAFNPDIISDVTLIKSGINAEYGGKIASVIDIKTIDSKANKLIIKTNLGLLSGKFYIDAPLIKNKLAVQFSARKSFIDEILKPFKNSGNIYGSFISSTKYGIQDINGKINIYPSKKDKFSFTALYSADRFSFKQDDYDFYTKIGWNNSIFSAQWNHVFNNNHFFNLCLNHVQYMLSFEAAQSTNRFNLNSLNRDFDAKIKFTLLKGRHTIKYGFEQTYRIINPTDQNVITSRYNISLSEKNNFYSHETALFLNDNFSYNKFSFNVGLRISLFNHTGPYKKYFYDQFGIISDSLIISKNQIIKTYFNPEPRFTATYHVDSISSLKLSFTNHAQYIHMAPISSVSLPADIWVPSTLNIKPQTGWQIASGYYRYFDRGIYETSVELYYKSFRNIIEFKNEIFSLSENDFEKKITTGKGYAYGIEFLLNKKNGNLTGWISYTLSKSMRQFDELNFGKPFFAKYDRTHDLSIVANYSLNTKWVFAAIFNYATGNALTIPSARYLIQGKVVNYYNKINGYRMPPYHRLDISATYIFKIFKLDCEINLSVINVYNRANPYFIYYFVETNLDKYSISVKPKLVSLYPVLPSFSLSVNF